VTVIPVRHGRRPVGAYVVNHGSAAFLAVVDITRLATAGMVFVAVTTAAATAAAALRRSPAIGAVTMGPGGWISLKGVAAPTLRDGAGRPWWARLLGAHRLVVDRR
jgi:hypothetical protein